MCWSWNIWLGRKKTKSSKLGLTGIGLGIVGFILTLVYVIYNGIVYFNYYDSPPIYKTDEQGKFAEYNRKKKAYVCIYYKKDDLGNLFATYYDLLKSQYNYNYDLLNSFNNEPEKKGCSEGASPELCEKLGFFYGNYTYGNGSLCTKYYYNQKIKEIGGFKNYHFSARFLTCFILSIFILLFYCVLIFCGITLFEIKSREKTKNGHSYFFFQS